jgi:dipeptidase D
MQKPQNYPTQPEHLWNHFFDFTQTPRPSKEEEKIRQHLIGLAEKYKHEYKTDDEGNIVIYVPGSKDKENLEPVIIQNHIDMVTDATPDRKINFSTDPIITKVEGDWLKADRTTLGADNGIGCAAALALMTDDSISHPPLELLFTTDEETGLNGAWGVQSSFFKAKRMINLDTEEWGSLYTGCAGGIDKQFNKKIEMTKGADGLQAFKLTIGKLRGGHSGVDIHMQLGNAIKLLGEYLKEIKIDMELAEFRGGRAHNIIPRDAYAIIRTEMKNEQRLIDVGNELVERWKSYLPEDDQGVNLTIERIDGEFEVIQNLVTSLVP